jgi:hypothetical protein
LGKIPTLIISVLLKDPKKKKSVNEWIEITAYKRDTRAFSNAMLSPCKVKVVNRKRDQDQKMSSEINLRNLLLPL